MAEISSTQLAQRVDALEGIDAVREATAGIPAYLVGGSVRDLLLGAQRTDLDVVVEGPVEEVARRLGGSVRSHERFATATIALDGLEVDLAQARAESYPRPGALPEVRPATLSEDLARRDFTVNAIAWPLSGDGSLVDPHGGVADLRARILRILHERSFEDDPTRALRAARYASRFGFALEPRTEELLRAADLATVSSERIEAELRKLADEPGPRAGFELLSTWGLLELEPDAPPLIEAVARLGEREPWRGVAERADAVLGAARGGRDPRVSELAEARPTRPSEGVALARGSSGVQLVLARALGADWLDRYVGAWRHTRLAITGGDLLAAGIPEGPAVGRGLRAALEAKLDGEIQTRDQELATAVAAAGAGE